MGRRVSVYGSGKRTKKKKEFDIFSLAPELRADLLEWICDNFDEGQNYTLDQAARILVKPSKPGDLSWIERCVPEFHSPREDITMMRCSYLIFRSAQVWTRKLRRGDPNYESIEGFSDLRVSICGWRPARLATYGEIPPQFRTRFPGATFKSLSKGKKGPDGKAYDRRYFEFPRCVKWYWKSTRIFSPPVAVASPVDNDTGSRLDALERRLDTLEQGMFNLEASDAATQKKLDEVLHLLRERGRDE